MNEVKKNKLRKILLQYPGSTIESVAHEIIIYEEREQEKRFLIENRKFSNTLAEIFLDKKGYPRPPGWHSVFFYPDSNLPRFLVIFWLVISFLIAWWFLK